MVRKAFELYNNDYSRADGMSMSYDDIRNDGNQCQYPDSQDNTTVFATIGQGGEVGYLTLFFVPCLFGIVVGACTEYIGHAAHYRRGHVTDPLCYLLP